MQGEVFGNWSALSWLVIPVVVAAGAAISYVLGPAGEPAARSRREGAVSRTLRRLADEDEES